MKNSSQHQYPMRYPTKKSIEFLSKYLNLPTDPFMQDWEYEVADPHKINEFMAAYHSDKLNDNDKFLLMELILQSIEDSTNFHQTLAWENVLNSLENNIPLHATSICYWACGNSPLEDCWKITPYIRKIRDKFNITITTK